MIRNKIKTISILAILIFTCFNANAFFFNKKPKKEGFSEGDFIYVYKSKWRPAKILKIYQYNNQYYFYISYVGQDKVYDEWINPKLSNK